MALRYSVAYGATLVVMLVLDFAWLGTIGGPLFKRTLGDVLAPNFAVVPAILFYMIYGVGVVYFATGPALEADAWTVALVRGLLFGFFAYATYDLTNLATLRNYTVGLAVIDMAWGAVVTGAAASLGWWLTDLIVRRVG